MRMRIGGEERWIAPRTPGLYRDALGAVPPGGLPDAFLEEVEEPLARLARRYARTHGPFTTREVSDRYGLDFGPVLRELERAGHARPRRAAPRRQRARVVRHRRAAPAAARLAGDAPQGGRARRAARARALPARMAGGRPCAAGRRRRGSAARDAGAAPGPRAGAGGLGARRAPAPGGRLLAGLDGPALRERRARVGGRGRARAEIGASGAASSARTRASSARRRSRASGPGSLPTT